ncbi:hypothetical protein PHYBLDRAFT_160328 [Phycomyces blakesleeanus NRRL 1555(-)]|uniref:Uncharacterized protein n=1 Tax=Phycomyces blakesleeanus (strain ATCC 8743b / DSM 1359 / FGSC 10004 / NBRC 33097 / NRRL 1555) TaxID=763407 RepID=A0A162N308_PHYB8|nr:hypothetical protein PHYBLDRAFT_160328 [Phycomyces blakesleeanus NRRL 1555(-)]OAD67988.1 hypothetical protein PHYBLDRAFT_160328 [Phycomyces blakesleeanus NRRL 1555(-)]|eukprot:XP_018286028.1 hypothetical protein PHYBLDRAFT_160328 [Phycomyces blakesleeanus NRRL 1555(-)]
MAINPTIPSLPNDEGFASTLEEQQTADIIRRKKAQSLNSLASLTQTINETKSNQKHMALTERLLWLISVFWALWKLQINDATPLDNLTVIGNYNSSALFFDEQPNLGLEMVQQYKRLLLTGLEQNKKVGLSV